MSSIYEQILGWFGENFVFSCRLVQTCNFFAIFCLGALWAHAALLPEGSKWWKLSIFGNIMTPSQNQFAHFLGLGLIFWEICKKDSKINFLPLFFHFDAHLETPWRMVIYQTQMGHFEWNNLKTSPLSHISIKGFRYGFWLPKGTQKWPPKSRCTLGNLWDFCKIFTV